MSERCRCLPGALASSVRHMWARLFAQSPREWCRCIASSPLQLPPVGFVLALEPKTLRPLVIVSDCAVTLKCVMARFTSLFFSLFRCLHFSASTPAPASRSRSPPPAPFSTSLHLFINLHQPIPILRLSLSLYRQHPNKRKSPGSGM